MNINTDIITPGIARDVLWHYGAPGGLQPGSFIDQLMTTIGVADRSNIGLLARGFPGHVAAMKAAMYSVDGVAELRVIAESA